MMFSESILWILFIFINLVILAIYFKNRSKAKKHVLEIALIMTVVAITLVVALVFIDYPKVNQRINSRKSNNVQIQSGGSPSRKGSGKREQFRGQTKQQKLQDMCGLPDSPETSHCFVDDTHHSCCMLGPNTQRGVSGTTNDVAKTAREAYMKKHNLNQAQLEAKIKNEKISLPWCTCTGSTVCSQYDRAYGDSKIKFINNPKSQSGEVMEDVGTNCEKHVKELYDIRTHLTPSVKPDFSKPDVQACEKALRNKKRKLWKKKNNYIT